MGNPIFQILAKEFSGANEYMALERLFTLHEANQFDCIILDTPPSRNTLAFLNAPKLLAQFFEEKLIRWLIVPANKIVAAGMKKAVGLLEKLTGGGFMKNLMDFATDLFEVQANFTANLAHIMKLLESEKVGLVMVAAPSPDTVPESLHFVSTVREHGFHFDGIALNRTLGYLKAQSSTPEQGLKPALEVLSALQERERRVLEKLSETRHPAIPICAKVPELARDVHSVEDLFHVALALGANP
jgi:anion-transporting  ArsA/GET3 family ATPase